MQQQPPPYSLPPGYRLIAVPANQAIPGALPLPPMPPPPVVLNHPPPPPSSAYLVPVSGPPTIQHRPSPFPPPGYSHPHPTPIPPPPQYNYASPSPLHFPSYVAPLPPTPAAHFRPLPVPIYTTSPPQQQHHHAPTRVAPPPPPPENYLQQRPVFDFAHAPGSLYHQRFQSIATSASDDAVLEGLLGFSVTGEGFAPYWIRLHDDLLHCHEQQHQPPIWKIKLWGTSIEPFDERTHPTRFMVITGLGQVFSFQASTPEEAVVWISALNSAAAGASDAARRSRPPPTIKLANAPPSSTEHKSPAAASAAKPAIVPTTETPHVALTTSTLNRRSTGIGGFLSSLFEVDEGKWLKELPAQSDKKKFVFEQLRIAMNSPSHTLGKPVEAFASKVLASSTMTEEDFDKLVREILDFIRDSIALIGKTHPDLTSVAGWEEIAHRATEVSLLPKIYTRVSKLYEWKYRAENERHAAKNVEFLTVTPAHLNIPKLFWLSHTVESQPSEADIAKWVPPYFDAIELLKQLPTLKSASLKLDCLVEVGKCVCTCINKFWEGRIDPAKLIVGADDLLPIMTYVVVKARIPSLYSEAMLMQDLMSEKAAMEIGGYSLATLQTCLSYEMGAFNGTLTPCLRHLMVLEKREALQAGEDQLRAKIQGGSAVNVAASPSSSAPATATVADEQPPVEAEKQQQQQQQQSVTDSNQPPDSSTPPPSDLSLSLSPSLPPPATPPPEASEESTPPSVAAATTAATTTTTALTASKPPLMELPVILGTPPIPRASTEPIPPLPPPPGDRVPLTKAPPAETKPPEDKDLMQFGD